MSGDSDGSVMEIAHSMRAVSICAVSLHFTQMFEPFWEAVEQLERCGYRMRGLSANRRLYGGSHKTATHEERYI